MSSQLKASHQNLASLCSSCSEVLGSRHVPSLLFGHSLTAEAQITSSSSSSSIMSPIPSAETLTLCAAGIQHHGKHMACLTIRHSCAAHSSCHELLPHVQLCSHCLELCVAPLSEAVCQVKQCVEPHKPCMQPVALQVWYSRQHKGLASSVCQADIPGQCGQPAGLPGSTKGIPHGAPCISARLQAGTYINACIVHQGKRPGGGETSMVPDNHNAAHVMQMPQRKEGRQSCCLHAASRLSHTCNADNVLQEQDHHSCVLPQSCLPSKAVYCPTPAGGPAGGTAHSLWPAQPSPVGHH